MLLLNYKQKLKQVLLCILAIGMPLLSIAQDAAATSAPEATTIGKYQMMRYILTGMAVLLLLIIMVMGNAVASAGKIYWERSKQKKSSIHKTLLLLMVMGAAAVVPAYAQEAEAATAVIKGPGIPKDIYIFFFIVALEFVIIMALAGMLIKFLKPEVDQETIKANKKVFFQDFFKKVNQTVAIEEESTIDLQHDYDGIRELDNKVPKWWQYSFYASMLFGVVYIYRMFVAGSLPDQIQELGQANEIAAIQQAEYLKNSANNVDENNVTMLDADGIAAGAVLYTKNCVACHGDQGQGTVGPNLTDEYWLHEGDLKGIFHSIKYGWPEKGMKSWKDDFSPAQMAQLASYIKSIKGTNPPGAKEPQGTLLAEGATTPADTAVDSTKTNL